MPCARHRLLLDGQRRRCPLLEIEVLVLPDADADAEYLPASERGRRLVFLADVVAAVAADAEAVTRQRELACLRPHRPFRDDLVVDVELRLADRLVVLAGAFPREFHAECV